jgi:hypothetical protein
VSRASAYLVTPSGERLGEMIYCGTSDVLYPGVYSTSEEAWRQYRTGERDDWERLDRCTERPPHLDHLAEAYAYSDYGGGFWWPVRWCRACRVVHDPLAPYDGDESGWPKDGEPPIEGSVAHRELTSGGGS